MLNKQDSPQTPDVSPGSGRKKKIARRILLFLGPFAVAVGAGYLYLTGGRYVHTDNAYVQADKVAISAEVSGSIVEVLVKENDYVEKGAPLFRIDNRDYTIALARAKANMQEAVAEIRKLKESYSQKVNELKLAQSNIDFTQKEYSRQTALDSKQAVAKSQLDESRHDFQVSQYQSEIIKTEMAQILARLEGDPDIQADRLASYKLAKAMVEKASLDLEKTTVCAPFSGRVSKIPLIGKYVDPGTAVMSLIADSSFWIEANLKETELTHVRAGQKVSIEIDTYPDREFVGTVQSISPGTGSEFSIIPAQNATGNWVKVVQRVPVRVSVNEHDDREVLRSGLSSEVRIDTGYRRAMPHWLKTSLALFGFPGDAVAAENDRH